MLSRRGFFKGHQKIDVKIRPPYGNENDFQSKCVKCESKECVDICETKIISLDESQIPYLDFKDFGCTFCEDCANACPNDVLLLDNEHKIKAIFKISKEKCLAYNQVICSSCKEPCIDDAISFNGMFSPMIDLNKCTSCGYCVGKCPNDAIDIEEYIE